MHKTPLLPLSLATLALLCGCSSSRHDPTEKIVLVSANVKLPYWQAASAGLNTAARQLGIAAETAGPDTYDPQKQVEDFRRIVAKKPAGILVSPADPSLMKPEIDAAIAKGIPVITVDSDSPASKRLTFVGTNNHAVGVMGGKIAVKQLNGKGTVVIYTMPGQENLDDRLQGYKTVFADNPGMKITEVIDVKGDPRIAFDRTSDMVDKKTMPDAFICLESSSCAEVADVLDRKKVSGKTVIAMDTNKETIIWLQKGVIAATIAQKPFTMTFVGVKMLDDLIHYKPASLDGNWSKNLSSPVPALIDTGALLIDKSNVDDFVKTQEAANSGAK